MTFYNTFYIVFTLTLPAVTSILFALYIMYTTAMVEKVLFALKN
jgi:hypothetical protein